MIPAPPIDGWTKDEQFFLKALVISMYNRIETPLDKFIVMAKHELGYNQTEIAEMLGWTQAAVSKRLKNTIVALRSIGRRRL